jgi:hypothetical protein
MLQSGNTKGIQVILTDNARGKAAHFDRKVMTCSFVKPLIYFDVVIACFLLFILIYFICSLISVSGPFIRGLPDRMPPAGQDDPAVNSMRNLTRGANIY